jgi:anti-sigma factor RsiW
MTVPTTDPRLLVHAYVDGELDPAHALEMERRFASDPALAAERDRVEALRRAIREQLPREAAPAGLARRIETSLGLQREDARMSSHPSWRVARISSHPSWRALAASVVLAVFLSSGATWFALRPDRADTTADMVVASHVRALMAPQPFDVASSDRHTVKPWFNGRITDAPRVVDLADQGFPLVGGRVDVIGRTPVATLVYRHRQHLISLTAVPGGRATATAAREIAGYNVVSWNENGVGYNAVSDVAASDLETFAKAFRTASAEQ